MKLLFRAVTALALVGLATPAFPCGDKKMTTASTADAEGEGHGREGREEGRGEDREGRAEGAHQGRQLTGAGAAVRAPARRSRRGSAGYRGPARLRWPGRACPGAERPPPHFTEHVDGRRARFRARPCRAPPARGWRDEHAPTRGRLRRPPLAALGACLLMAGRAHAQATAPVAEAREELVVGDVHYAEAGWFQRFLFGDDYRDLWARPSVGGARPRAPRRRAHAGPRGRGRSRAAGSRCRARRALVHVPRHREGRHAGLEPELRATIAGGSRRIRSRRCTPPRPVVGALLEAAGVLHAAPRLVVMPDDERLGAFRATSRAPSARSRSTRCRPPSGRPVRGRHRDHRGEALLARLYATPGRARRLPRVPARAARGPPPGRLGPAPRPVALGEGCPGARGGSPSPRTATSRSRRFEGLCSSRAELDPRWVVFGEEYPDMLGLTWQAWPLDRRLLSELEKAAGTSRRRSPAPAHRRRDRRGRPAAAAPSTSGRRGAARERAAAPPRPASAQAAVRFYRHLAEEVRVEATDGPTWPRPSR